MGEGNDDAGSQAADPGAPGAVPPPPGSWAQPGFGGVGGFPPSGPPNVPPPPPGSLRAPAPPATTDGFAIAAFVLAVLGGIPLSVILALVARHRIRTSRSKTGMGWVTAALLICAAWIVLAIGAFAFADVFDEDNVDDYRTGPERQIALVIDRFEEGGPEAICRDLVTDRLRTALDLEVGGCRSAFDLEGVAADIDIVDIAIDGDIATVTVEELGDTYTVVLIDDGIGWRIDGFE